MAAIESRQRGAASNTRVENLRQAAQLPVSGPVLTVADLAADLRCSRRKAEMIIESGEIASFRDGRRRLVTQAARDDYIRRLIADEIERLESLST